MVRVSPWAVRKAILGVRSIASAAKDDITQSVVHIRVYPRPQNLAESRGILRVLETYGEVVVYKHLKYEPQAPAPNSIIAIYQNPSSAQRLINASPFRSEIELKDSVWTYAGSEPLKGAEAFDTDAQSASEEAGRSATEGDPDNDHEGGSSDEANAAAKSIKAEDDGFQGFSGTGKWGAMNRQAKPSLKPSNDQVLPPKGYLVDPTTLPKPDTSNGTPVSTSKIQPPQYKGLPIRRFELYVTPSHMNSQAYIERQGYYTDFVPDRRSIMAEDLEGRVPLEGLFDCRIKKEEVHLRIRNKRKEKDFPNVFSLKALWDNRTV